jgi:hypothetical protein
MLGMTSIAMKIMVSNGKKLAREFISPFLFLNAEDIWF